MGPLIAQLPSAALDAVCSALTRLAIRLLLYVVLFVGHIGNSKILSPARYSALPSATIASPDGSPIFLVYLLFLVGISPDWMEANGSPPPGARCGRNVPCFRICFHWRYVFRVIFGHFKGRICVVVAEEVASRILHDALGDVKPGGAFPLHRRRVSAEFSLFLRAVI